MPYDPDQRQNQRGLVRRALWRTRRAAGAAVRSGLTRASARAFESGGPLVAQMTGRVGDMVDAASTRLLATDEAASQLAYFVELIAAEVEREEVVSVVLRRNLLLDGTVLGLISPLLSGERAIGVDPARLAQASETLTFLLQELVTLRSGTPGPTDATTSERLEWLEEHAPDLPTDALAPFLKMERDPEEVAAFVLSSYSLFLQTFLLRSTVRMAAKLAVPLLPEAQ